jgi:hypothetical protein
MGSCMSAGSDGDDVDMRRSRELDKLLKEVRPKKQHQREKLIVSPCSLFFFVVSSYETGREKGKETYQASAAWRWRQWKVDGVEADEVDPQCDVHRGGD